MPATQTIMPWNGIRFDSTGSNQLASSVIEQQTGSGYQVVYPNELAAAKITWPELALQQAAQFARLVSRGVQVGRLAVRTDHAPGHDRVTAPPPLAHQGVLADVQGRHAALQSRPGLGRKRRRRSSCSG